jgi:PAS domain S-box-containing protein
VNLFKAVKSSGEVIFLTDAKGIITYINPEFTRLYGYKAEEVVGKTTPRILKSGKTAPQFDELFWNKLLNKEIVWGEWINRCKDGRLLYVEGSANPIQDDNGNIIGFLAIQRDITERKQAEEEIKQRNKELAALNAVAASVSHSLDLNQILTNALDEVLSLKIISERMYGMLFLLDEQHQTLRLAAQRGAPEDHPCLTTPVKVGECLCGQAVQQGKVIISQNSWEEQQHTRHWPGMTAHKDVCIPLKARGITLGILEVRLPRAHEINDNDMGLLKAVADQIGVAIENAQLRELRERAIVEERERIARELHDGLSQLLGYVNTKAIAARLLLSKRQIKAADQQLLQLEEATKELSVDVREAILGLKMAGQSSAGLALNLNEFIASFSRLSGLPVKLAISPEVDNLPLNAETEYQLMRIVQEALNNVRKHASASQAWVNVQFKDNQLDLSITDDGIGFEPQTPQANHKGHFGLNTMRERANSIGAELTIESSVDHGSRIRVRLVSLNEVNQ